MVQDSGAGQSGVEGAQLMKKEETKIEKASVREATAKEIKNPELRGLVNEWVRSMNKIIIIDQETVITGSFNFTKAAEEQER